MNRSTSRASALTRRGLVLAGMAALSLSPPTASVAHATWAFDTVGEQKVLVILLDYPQPLCPSPLPDDLPTPFDPRCEERAAAIAAPRHTAAEWQAFLDLQVNAFYGRATYGQMHFTFTVLANPDRANGWWTTSHRFARYYLNDSWWHDTPPRLGLMSDAVGRVVDLAVKAGVITVAQVKTHDRLLVLDNLKAHDGQTYGTGIPFSFNTESAGVLSMTATKSAESFDDFDALGAITHEFGHQFGLTTHYSNADCTAGDLASLTGLFDYDTCLRFWDIMAVAEPVRQQFTAYSMLTGKWIRPESTETITPPAVGTTVRRVVIGPLERRPSSKPNVIRILTSGEIPGAAVHGYLAECRERIGIDATILKEGLLITKVHEGARASYVTGTPPKTLTTDLPPVSAVRQTTPTDQLDYAPLSPGESFTDPRLGVSVKFLRYMPAPRPSSPRHPPPPGRDCEVEVTVNGGLRTEIHILPSPPAIPRTLTPGFVSPDVFFERPPVAGRPNRIGVRVHNTGTTPVGNVAVAVRVTQPAFVEDTCGASSNVASQPAGTALLQSIAPGRDQVAFVDWVPSDGSVRIDATARGTDDQGTIAEAEAASAFALLPAGGGQPAGSGTPEATTRFRVAAGNDCNGPRSFVVGPTRARAGWTVHITPEAFVLSPGQTQDVDVAVLRSHAGRSEEEQEDEAGEASRGGAMDDAGPNLPVAVFVEPPFFPPPNQVAGADVPGPMVLIGGVDLLRPRPVPTARHRRGPVSKEKQDRWM